MNIIYEVMNLKVMSLYKFDYYGETNVAMHSIRCSLLPHIQPLT